MKGHPLHGTNPLAQRLSVEAVWAGTSNLYLFKLARPGARGRLEIHPSAGKKVGRAMMGEDGRPLAPGADVKTWAKAFPGWEPVFA